MLGAFNSLFAIDSFMLVAAQCQAVCGRNRLPADPRYTLLCAGVFAILGAGVIALSVLTGKTWGYGRRTCPLTGISYISKYAIITYEDSPLQYSFWMSVNWLIFLGSTGYCVWFVC